ncbi:MAG: hypothetical protein E6K94_09575 [Thaumarchaeota archaeon]|nr:MAG: hypothetical protein E6K94_09575 [Nitrososphaerota archaeon]
MGIELRFAPGKSSLCHIPIPTPVIMDDKRAKVKAPYLLFNVKEGQGQIKNIHVYDGPFRFQTFDNLSLKGKHDDNVDNVNTISLTNFHEVIYGMSISFYFTAPTGIDSPIPPPLLTITTAGADFLL